MYVWIVPRKRVAVVERFKEESIYGLSLERKWSLWSLGDPSVEVRLY